MSSPGPLVDIVGATGFVNTVKIAKDDSNNGSLWNQSSSINFVLFMVIGFCATLGFIALLVFGYFLYRKLLNRRVAQAALKAEQTATVPEPKELFVVVHPGGTADVAHREDDDEDQPRKLVLKNKPIELNSAVINFDTIPAYREEEQCSVCQLDIRCTADKQFPSPHEGALEVQPIRGNVAEPPHRRPKSSSEPRFPFSAPRTFQQGGNCTSSSAATSTTVRGQQAPYQEREMGAICREGLQRPPARGVHPSCLTMEQLFSQRSTTSDDSHEDSRLLTKRYTRS